MNGIPEVAGERGAPGDRPGFSSAWGKRTLVGLGLFFFLLGMGRTVVDLVRLHGGIIGGDSFTYVTCARRLAQGSLFYMDGPVSDMLIASERPDRRYWEPIWNHAVRPDGHTVCSMAIGYPLLLSLAMRTGGIWLLYHANLFLTAGFLLMLALVVWEGLGRNVYAGLTAITVVLVLPYIVPQAIRQFTYPWREPYFYSLLLGAVWALLRFQRSGRGAWLCTMALLSGIACSVKEVNAFYVFWFGVMVLTLPGYRRHPRVGTLTFACAAFFLAGIFPLLVQNAVGTGNPFLSFQLLRETSQYSLSAPGAGLSMGNMGSTLSRYVALYAKNPFYAPWVMALVVLGAGMSLRHLLGRTLLGLALLHFILYAQWGNADLRQSYFFNVPYVFFLVYGPFALGERLSRSASGHLRTLFHLGQIAIIAVMAFRPSPFPRPTAEARAHQFQYTDGLRLAAEIDARLPPDALLLVNRPIRDILGAFSERHFIRLSALAGLRKDHDVYPFLDPLVRSGRLFFLDNVDRDPHYRYRANRTRIDQETLLDRYRLEPVARWNRDALKLGFLVDQQKLTLLQVLPWKSSTGRCELKTPPEGADFLFVNRRSASTNLVVELDGRVVPLPGDDGYYCPVTDWHVGPVATVDWRSIDGSPVPPMEDLALVGWHEAIGVDFGLDAVPRDAPHVPGGLPDPQFHAPWRFFPDKFCLRLPVFARPGLFCACVIAGADNADAFEVDGPDPLPVKTQLIENKVLIPVWERSLGASLHPVASNALFRFTLRSNSTFKLGDVEVLPCRRSLVIAASPESRGIFWSGRFVSDPADPEAPAWSISHEGIVLDTGKAQANPFSKTNEICGFWEFSPGDTSVQFDVHGGGVMEVNDIPLGKKLEIRLDRDTLKLIAGETYEPEHNETGALFCWSKGVLRVRVPLTPGAKAYRLRLDARDGHPRLPRELEIVFGDARTRIPLEPGRRTYEWVLPAPAKAWGLATLEFHIATWKPNELLGTPDHRELGFQFYGLDWRPREDEPR